MDNIEYIEVGRVLRSQGIQGELIVELLEDIKNDIKLVYIDLNDGGIDMGEGDSKVAYNIENFKLRSDGFALIRFMEISGRSQTSFLEGKTLYVAKEDCYPNSYIIDGITKGLSGYRILDKDKKMLGKIIGFQKVRKGHIERILMVLEFDNQELPIPFDEKIIKSIDHSEKIVYVNMPFEYLEVLLTDR